MRSFKALAYNAYLSPAEEFEFTWLGKVVFGSRE